MGKQTRKLVEPSDVAIYWSLARYKNELSRTDLIDEAHKILEKSCWKLRLSKKALGNRIDKLEDEGTIVSEKAGRKSIKSLNTSLSFEVVPPIEMRSIPVVGSPFEKKAGKIIDEEMKRMEIVTVELWEDPVDLKERLKILLSTIWEISEEKVAKCIEDAFYETVYDIAFGDLEFGVADVDKIIESIFEDSSEREKFKENLFRNLNRLSSPSASPPSRT